MRRGNRERERGDNKYNIKKREEVKKHDIVVVSQVF